MNRPAFDLERQSDDGPLSYRRGRPQHGQKPVRGKPVAEEISIFGAPQSSAEAELYAYLDRGRGSLQNGFPPIRELTSRLGEFTFDRQASKPASSPDPEGVPEAQEREESDETARLARAAGEIFRVAQSMEKTRLDLQALAASTHEEIVTTVKSAAVQAAAIAVKRVEAAAKHAFASNFTQLDANVRDLQARTSEIHNLTNQVLSRMDVTLGKVLKQSESAFHPRDAVSGRPKRQSVHMPINAIPRPSSARDGARQTASTTHPALASIIERTAKPAPAVAGAAASIDAKVNREPPAFLRALKTESEEPQQAVPGRIKQAIRDETVGFPVIGIAIVALVMLLASAALYVLHARHEGPSGRSATLSSSPVKPGVPVPALQTLNSELAIPPQQSSFQAVAPGIDMHSIDDMRRVFAAAQQGDAEAQFRTGICLLNNPADSAAGARWLIRAAEHGHTQALFSLASLYERGVGVAVDRPQALALYRRAAERGHARAMHNLAVLLHESADSHADVEAAKWFAEAASRGITPSQYNLGVFYERGFGVQADIDKAYFWYSIAAAAGDDEAKLQAGRLSKAISASSKALATENMKLWKPSS